MSLASESENVQAHFSDAEVGDYLALLKPRVMSLVIFTALTGMVLAPTPMHPLMAFIALLCIAVGAGASGALNMWYDADIDARMKRTSARPVPAGRIQPGEALGFGLLLAGFSVVMLALLVNLVAGAMLAFTIFFYAVVYTMWLKRSTPQNIVIGGAAGAFPPMIGWAAATGTVSMESVLMFLIIFFWTPPHFWALAIFSADDYARAGVPMLPVVSGARETRKQILIYTLILVPLGMSPWLFGFAGLTYGVVSAVAGAAILALAARMLTDTSNRAAKQLFGFSILYLFLLFAFLMIDRAVVSYLGLLG